MGWRMKRWLANRMKQWLAGGLATLLGLGILSGCQPTYLVQANMEAFKPADALRVDETCGPTTNLTPRVQAPPNVNEPERPQRPMTLQEAIALALENGTVSGNNPGAGVADPTFFRFNGPGSLNGQTDYIRVLALNPAQANASMEASLARFDAIWVTGASWTNTDSLAGVPNLPGYLGSVPGQTANFQSSIIKAFSSGGVANVSFITDYRNVNNAASNPLAFAPQNPEWAARIAFGFEQPLWRDFGSDINSLLQRFPAITGSSIGSIIAQTAYNAEQGNRSSIAGLPVEGTLISRLRQDQTKAEFERNVQILVLNTEVAYWNLYNKYGQLYSFEENLRILQKAFQESYHQWKGDKLGGDKYYQFKGQFEEFRGNRYDALEQVLQAERDLRRIIGLPVEDGTRITPITPPTIAQFRPEWENCLQDTLTLSPELILARENLRYHQYLLTVQKNNLKPDLRAYLRYEPFGDGTSLLGSGPNTYTDSSNTVHSADALRNLSGGHLVDWQAGLYLNVPLGFRLEYAAIRTARLQLAQAYYALRDQEDRKTNYLAGQWQDVIYQYEKIGASRAERVAYLESLKVLEDQRRAGKILFSDAQNGLQYLVIQRSYATALVKEFQAISDYNNAVARLEWAKGTTLKWNNVFISEGPLPQAAQVRATEAEKDRSRSLVLSQRPDTFLQPGQMCATRGCDVPTRLEGAAVVPPAAALPPMEKPAPTIPPSTTSLPAPSGKGNDAKAADKTPVLPPLPPHGRVASAAVDAAGSRPQASGLHAAGRAGSDCDTGDAIVNADEPDRPVHAAGGQRERHSGAGRAADGLPDGAASLTATPWERFPATYPRPPRRGLYVVSGGRKSAQAAEDVHDIPRFCAF